MIKHKLDMNVLIDGKRYHSVDGIVLLPTRMEKYNPIDEPKTKEPIEDEKELLVKQANELGLGSPSILRRNTIETLKKKIAEVE